MMLATYYKDNPFDKKQDQNCLEGDKMNKHTKGEWSVQNPIDMNQMRHIYIRVGKAIIARVDGYLNNKGWPNFSETTANAKLIAAAPKMKIMLESNIAYFRNLRRVWENYKDSVAAREMLSVIDDIIKQNKKVLAEMKV